MKYTEVNVEYHGVPLLLKGDFDKEQKQTATDPGCAAEYFLDEVWHNGGNITTLCSKGLRTELEELAVRKLEE